MRWQETDKLYNCKKIENCLTEMKKNEKLEGIAEGRRFARKRWWERRNWKEETQN